MGKLVTMVHMDNCLGLNHMENRELDKETGQECLWPVTLHGRGKKFTVKYFCVIGVHAK